MSDSINIIGGGLAGSEAAWQAVKRGVRVILHEMRPLKFTEVHKTGLFGELVCSNSLRSKDPESAPGLLKNELSLAGSLIMEAADATSVPAGVASAVDRTKFSEYITEKLSGSPDITIVRDEVTSLPEGVTVIATGPLTSSAMTAALLALCGKNHLYFYDAIAPIIDAESIEEEKIYRASRYGKGGEDYINCPLNRDEYLAFYDALISADSLTPREFESQKVFEGCMPVEVMASRGTDTLRFGPMKPVGLPDPITGREPYAVVQLRPENREKTAYNIVGFQTRLKWPEQKKVLSLIPGLGHAVFLRYGSLHRNTFINAPQLINKDLSMKARQDLFMAGQISGVEGYIESTAMGLIAGINASGIINGRPMPAVPETTAHGALIKHITGSEPSHFQPSNINFGLFSLSDELLMIRDKKRRRAGIVKRAMSDWEVYVRSTLP